ncbi:hypothetical protein QTH87_00405 [Variovorax sp. J22P168]|uniref:hypothetical protein n=1 Tax=Variovorax jilinensis TaxID=3053513 RepID=UPI002577F979|nr:hypothetical protein [Variovorax sp. J22P168]MDM0010885.1 hypothetical protein [Variovorax sp. J22P168]
MPPQAILAALWADGISVRLAPDGATLKVPAGRLTPGQRAMLVASKPEIIGFLKDAHDSTQTLIEVAMRVCDRYGDGKAAREDMVRDCTGTPPHLRADLIDYLKSAGPDRQEQGVRRDAG